VVISSGSNMRGNRSFSFSVMLFLIQAFNKELSLVMTVGIAINERIIIVEIEAEVVSH
jgi:hypothetical protein